LFWCEAVFVDSLGIYFYFCLDRIGCAISIKDV